MSEKRPLWRTIGLKNSSFNRFVRFESEDEMAELQQDMLELLKGGGVDRDQYDQLAACGSQRCGADQCMEACWFGARRRRLREISPVYRHPTEQKPGLRGSRPSFDLGSADRTASRGQHRSSETIATPILRQAEPASAGCCRYLQGICRH